MNIAVESLVRLIHEVSYGCLATHSLEMPGYPFLSVLPLVPDEHHCPVFLISSLAEHTKNLRIDSRASFLLSKADSGDVQSDPRLTLIGNVEPLEPSRELTERFLRYQPSAAHYLLLPDFRFYRFQPKRMRMVAGFGRIGWLDGYVLARLMPLSPATEAMLTADLAAELPSDIKILGIDRYGIDLTRATSRHRTDFPGGPVPDDELRTAAFSALQRFNKLGGS